MKTCIFATFFLVITSATVFSDDKLNLSLANNKARKLATGECSVNPDKLYVRDQVLRQLIDVLNVSVPSYHPKPPGFYIMENGNAAGFFVWDLMDITNNDIPSSDKCVDFINNHIYHFAPYSLEYSASHFLILENGKLRIYKSTNCIDSDDSLAEVISYLEPNLKHRNDKDEILFRIRNYRRYGSYIPMDLEPVYYCENETPTNNRKYSFDFKNEFRSDVLLKFSNVLNQSITGYHEHFNLGFFRDRSKAVGFFVYDLTHPTNRQTSFEERVYFLKHHIYHFAPIDLPWSFSFIAVLGESDIRVFKAINCKNKGDSLEDVLQYLKPKLKNDPNKNAIFRRVKNYRKYGVYAPFKGVSEPQCNYFEVNDDESLK